MGGEVVQVGDSGSDAEWRPAGDTPSAVVRSSDTSGYVSRCITHEDFPKLDALRLWDEAMQAYLQATSDASMAGRLGLTNDETWDATVRAQDAYSKACDGTSTGALGGYGWRKKPNRD